MAKKNDLIGSLSHDEFVEAHAKTKIRHKGKSIAYEVLVKGMDISAVASKYEVSYQWAKNICERVYNALHDSDSVEFSVSLPAEIAPQFQQILNSVKTIYETGKKNGGKE